MPLTMPAPADPNTLLDGSSPEALVLRRASNELNAELTPRLIHDVNNVLTGIYFNLESCQELVGSDSAAGKALLEISQGVERIKEVLSRATQIHLNVQERETTYHDLGVLAASELDLLRLVFPRTAKIQFQPPESAIHVRLAEFPFRVALLAIAARLRPFVPTGRIEIFVSVLTTSRLLEIATKLGEEVPPHSVAVSFHLPCAIDSVTEIDSYPAGGGVADISLAKAENILSLIGGRLLFWNNPDAEECHVLLVLPSCDLNE